MSYNPNSTSVESNGIFGLPHSVDEAKVVLMPVPWEATVTYKTGTSLGPHLIRQYSHQLDIYHPDFPDLWHAGIAEISEDEKLRQLNQRTQRLAQKVIEGIEKGEDERQYSQIIDQVNTNCQLMVDTVKHQVEEPVRNNKIVGLIGGDHSISLGLIQTLHKQYPKFTVLQIDAHLDLRVAYQSFTYSHASIMTNVLNLCPGIQIIPVGARDMSPDERLIADQSKRLIPFYQSDIQEKLANGIHWQSICDEIVDQSDSHVYVTLDMDGCDIGTSVGTGTPVPGGCSVNHIYCLLKTISLTKKIIKSIKCFGYILTKN